MSSGLDALANTIRRHPILLRAARSAVYLIPDIPWTVKVPTLGPLRIRLRRHRWFLYQDFRKSDAVMIDIFRRLVRPGDVVFDVGANIGVYTRYVLHALNASSVVAFEPMSGNLELLRENVRLGEVSDRCRVLELALGSVDGDEDLQIDDLTSGTAVLDSISGGKPSEGRRHHGLPPAVERVRVRRLDTLMQAETLPAPNVIKIDTEGAEALVLDGARETLRRQGPRLAIALHGPDKALATLKVLEDIGYSAFGAVREKSGLIYRRLGASDSDRLGNNNIVASPIATDLNEPIQSLTT